MTSDIFIVGAGGHARSVINLVESAGKYRITGIIDETYNPEKIEMINGYPISGSELYRDRGAIYVLAIGDNELRAKIFNTYSNFVVSENIFHSSAILAARVSFGRSNLIFPGVIINSNAEIGSNNIINSGCIIEHETLIGDNNHISVGAIIAGRCKLGSNCFVGAGAVIIDKICICDDVLIGANSTVVADINEPGVYVGSPARRIK